MVRFNISPETAGDQPGNPQGLEPYTSGGEGNEQDPRHPQPGLVPQTLAPLLEKRLQLKTRVANLPIWDARRRPDQARAAAHKWLLVTCFGYLGYKNARFGRIEAHEAVTAYGREALLRAKEAAEDLGAEVLHMYVDGMWVLHPDWATPQAVQPLLEEIALRTGLSISLEGIYRWIVFLPSRVDVDLPVANRYFGVFQDGSLKVRGIEMRRRDTPAWIAAMQAQVLEILAQAPTLDALPGRLPAARRCVEQALADLHRGRVALEDLLVAQKLSRELSAYRMPSPAARAAAQMLAAGKMTRPGQRVRFLFTRGAPGVWAWDRPEPPDPRTLDFKRYETLLRRAAATILEPFADKANCAATCRSDLSFLTPA
jgi:DNA polymerase-2